MLEPKPIAPGEIVTVKLSSGEEIIGKLCSNSSTTVVISKPLTMTLIQVPGQPGQGAVAFVPFMLGINENSEVHLNKQCVIAMAVAQHAAASGYMKNTTGLEMPTPDALSKLDISNLKL